MKTNTLAVLSVSTMLSFGSASGATIVGETSVSSTFQSSNLSGLPALLVGNGFSAALQFEATGPSALEFQLNWLPSGGATAPLASDFVVENYSAAIDAGTLTGANQPSSTAAVFAVAFDGVDLYSFAVYNPVDVGGGYAVKISAPSLTESEDFTAGVAAVPEPSSVALLGLGGVALVLRRKK